jgi:Leucine-rich repeat (LRR) protein
MDFLRKKKPMPIDEQDILDVLELDEDDQQTPDKIYDDEETRLIIMDIIDALPDVQRICVLYRYYNQLSIEEIAAITGTNDNTVKSRLSLARKKIRAAILDKEEKEGIRLHAIIPIMPALMKCLEEFQMPDGLATRMWEQISGGTMIAAVNSAAITATSELSIAGAVKTAKLGMAVKIIAAAGAVAIAATTAFLLLPEREPHLEAVIPAATSTPIATPAAATEPVTAPTPELVSAPESPPMPEPTPEPEDLWPGNHVILFPDSAFEEAVRFNIGKPEGNITYDDVKNVTELNIAGIRLYYANEEEIEETRWMITDLSGIEYFTSLEMLNCNDNQLTSLDVSQNMALTYLNCYNNQLTSLDVSQNMALTYLYYSVNQLISLDLGNNTSLERISCDSNQLATLDVSRNTALTQINCSSNQLTALDVSNNIALTDFICSINPLMSLDVSKNVALTQLVCVANQLTSLDVSKNTALKRINCSSNQLTSLDFRNNTALLDLDCISNPLTSLNVSNNTALTHLNASQTQLTSLDVSNNTALEVLSSRHNQLTSLDVSNNTALLGLYVSYNQLMSLDVSNNTALDRLDVCYNPLTSLDVSKNSELTHIDCDSSLTIIGLDTNRTRVTQR